MSGKLQQIDLTEKEAAVLELRKAGWTFERIATHLGYASKSGAWKAFDRAMTATLQEPADELRRLECERLDTLFGAMYEIAVTKGSARHAEVCAGLMDRRAKLLGLDAPTRRVVNVITEDAIDVAIRELEVEIAANDPDRAVGDPSATGEASTLP
jgi:hypothetical protein